MASFFLPKSGCSTCQLFGALRMILQSQETIENWFLNNMMQRFNSVLRCDTVVLGHLKSVIITLCVRLFCF